MATGAALPKKLGIKDGHTVVALGARMKAAIDPATLATDLADLLVQAGIPFRQSHELVGSLVRRAEDLVAAAVVVAVAHDLPSLSATGRSRQRL